MLSEVVLLLLFVGLYVYYNWDKRHPKLPPGPTVYPLIGTLKMLTSPEDVKAMQRKYGDAFRTKNGTFEMIHLCNYKLIKEALTKPELSDRPNLKLAHALSNGEEGGIIFANGVRWQTTRRFLLRNLRDLGMGKSRMDDVVLREAEVLVENFGTFTNQPAVLPASLSTAPLNVIWQLVASQRYKFDDPEIHRFLKLMKSFQEEMAFLILLDLFPWLNKLPNFLFRRLFKQDMVDAGRETTLSLMQKVIDDHRANLDASNPRDVIDEYLLEMENQKVKISEFKFTEMELIRSIFDLFAAGMDTTAGMLRWMILYMAAYPDIQGKIQKQIDEVVPRTTLPSSIHRTQLPLIDAMLHELHRKSPLTLASVPRTASQDIYIGEYFIPKGVAVTAVTTLCHQDPEFWQNPDKFWPERFIDESGCYRPQRDGFIPFGLGRRSCLGEALARLELYIFSAALLQNFKFAPPQGCQIDLKPKEMFGQLIVKEQNIIITVRE